MYLLYSINWWGWQRWQQRTGVLTSDMVNTDESWVIPTWSLCMHRSWWGGGEGWWWYSLSFSWHLLRYIPPLPHDDETVNQCQSFWANVPGLPESRHQPFRWGLPCMTHLFKFYKLVKNREKSFAGYFQQVWGNGSGQVHDGQPLRAIDPRWQFCSKGFQVEYPAKQLYKLNGNSESNIIQCQTIFANKVLSTPGQSQGQSLHTDRG